MTRPDADRDLRFIAGLIEVRKLEAYVDLDKLGDRIVAAYRLEREREAA